MSDSSNDIGAWFLLIGYDPKLILGGDYLKEAIAQARKKAASKGIKLVDCGIPRDQAAGLQLIYNTLAEQNYTAVILGGGLHGAGSSSELLESVINLVHARAPQAAIGLTPSPVESVEVGQRAIVNLRSFAK